MTNGYILALVFGIVLIGISYINDAHAATYTATASGGNWNAGSTWTNGLVPGSEDDKIIPVGSTVTINTFVSNTGDITNSGVIIINLGGTLQNTNSFTSTGNIFNHGTITISSNNGISNSRFLRNYGTITISNSGGTGINNIPNPGTIFNFGTITISNSGGTGISNGATLTNSGTITISNSGGTGIINDEPSGVMIPSTMNNQATGTITISNSGGTGLNTVDNFNNSGTVNVLCNATVIGVISGNIPVNQCLFFIVDAALLTEGNSGTATMTFPVFLSPPQPTTVSVNYATVDDYATAGADYVPSTGTVIFPIGSTMQLVSISINGDTTIESNETFFVNLSTPSVTNAIISDPQGIGTILDDDSPPLLLPTLSVSDVSVTEGNSSITPAPFTISLSAPSTSTVTVDIATSEGTATTADNDYLDAGIFTVTFNPGDTTKQFIPPVNGDTTFESDETFTVILSNPVGATILDGIGVATILNDDTPLLLPTLSVSDVSVTEGNSSITPAPFTISLSAPSTSTVTVDIATSEGTATTADNDYLDAGIFTVTFNPGDTTKQFIPPVNGDTTFESDETFTVILSNPVGATILDGIGVATILNDDTPLLLPTLSVSDVSVTEGNSSITPAPFTISLSAPSTSTVTVDIATSEGTATTADNDYLDAGIFTVTFNPGDTTKQFIPPVNGDTTFESDETFTVILSNPVGATILDGIGVATILNDDTPLLLPTLSVSDVSVTEGNSSITPAPFTISLSAPSTSTVTVDIATSEGTATTADNDYLDAGIFTVTFNPGDTTKQFIPPVNGDTTFESDETFTVILSNPVGATILDGIGVATILNDDTPTISISNVSVTEGDAGTTPAPFTVSLSGPSTSTVTVDFFTFDGTATGDIDYTTASGTLTFSPGNTTQTVSIEVLGDTTVEANETFNVALSNPINASILDDTGVGTILDDDGIIIPPRAFLSINAGGSGTILSMFGSGFTSGSTVTIHFDGGAPIASTDVIDGKFTTPITIPAATSGLHSITASDGINTVTNQFILIAPRVTPTGTVLFLNPINSASPDSVVLLHGKGFAGNADATITISVDGVPITTTAVGKVGSFKNISITMPSALGTHTISASDGINTALSTFYIIP